MNKELQNALEKIIAEYRIKIARIEENRDNQIAKFNAMLYQKSMQELKELF